MAKAAKLETTTALTVVAGPEAKITTVVGRPGIVIYRPAEVEVFEDVDTGDTGLDKDPNANNRLAIIRLLDPKSPQVSTEDAAGIPGAKPGDIFNTQTNDVYDGGRGLYIIPAFKDLKFVKYKKRDADGNGGGFVGILEPEDPQVKDAKDLAIKMFGDTFRKLPAGENDDGDELELVETYYLYCICVVPNEDGSFPGEYGHYFEALVPFSSTAIKAYNAFLERCRALRYNVKTERGIMPREIAMWSHVWHLQKFYRKRGSQSWYIWQLSLASKNQDGTERHYSESRLPRDNPLYIAAENLRATALEGNAQVDYDKDQAGNAEAAAGSGADDEHKGGKGDTDIPFGQNA